MTDEKDPGMTFRLDQEAAEQETKTRDEMGWILQVRDADAQIRMKEAAAANEQAKASVRESITLAIYAGISVGAVWATAQGVQAVIGWVQ